MLAQSLGLVCKPFPQLRRLCINEDVQIGSDGQGFTSLLQLCPNLLQLEIERDHCYGQPTPDPECLFIHSDSLEVLKFRSLYYDRNLDIRTPKLRSAELGCEFLGAVVIEAPNLIALEIDISAKVTVLAPCKQLESLWLKSFSERDFLWDSTHPLHEALQSCSNLKYMAIEGGLITDVSSLTEALGSLTELDVTEESWCEVCNSRPENLRLLRKLTVSFDHRFPCKSLDEGRLFKSLRLLECFPKLESLRLQDTGDLTPSAAKALVSLQNRQPRLSILPQLTDGRIITERRKCSRTYLGHGLT